MLRTFIAIVLYSIVTSHVAGQQGGEYIRIGAEVQVYPTGYIVGVLTEMELSDHSVFDVRLGANMVRHGDAGVHDSERGHGFGGGLGYLYKFTGTNRGWLAGARCDLWFNKIDWEDYDGSALINAGTTDVTVVQPTARLGHRFSFKNGEITTTPSIAFGVEINAKTKGAPVGQGAILLLGLSVEW